MPKTLVAATAAAERSIPIVARKAALIKWIEEKIKEGGRRDRADVEEFKRELDFSILTDVH